MTPDPEIPDEDELRWPTARQQRWMELKIRFTRFLVIGRNLFRSRESIEREHEKLLREINEIRRQIAEQEGIKSKPLESPRRPKS